MIDATCADVADVEAMFLVSERCKPTVQLRADATLMSGWNAVMSSARFGLIAIGKVGDSGNVAG